MAARQIALLVIAIGCAVVLLVASATVSARFQLASETSHVAACADEKMQERMREIMLGALDVALNDRVEKLMEVWLKDATGQPARAKNGIDHAVAAYLHGHDAITRWKLPTC